MPGSLVDALRDELERAGYTVYVQGARKTFRVNQGEEVVMIGQPSVSVEITGIPLRLVEETASVRIEWWYGARPQPSNNQPIDCMGRADAFESALTGLVAREYGGWWMVSVERLEFRPQGRWAACYASWEARFKRYRTVR